MVILRVKQAECALADGRLDEALGLLAEPAVRAHRHGQDLATRLVAALVARGRGHLAAGRLPEASADADKARKVGGATPEVAALAADVQRAAASKQDAEHHRARLLDAARGHVRQGQLSVGQRMLDELREVEGTAGPAAALLHQEIEARRAATESLAQRVDAMLARDDWQGAADELGRADSAARSAPPVRALIARLAAGVLPQVRAAIEDGRLDLADSLLARLERADDQGVEAQQLRAALRQCRSAWDQLESGKLRQAEESVRRLAMKLPAARWLADAAARLREAVAALDELHGSPLGLLADRSALGGADTIVYRAPAAHAARPAPAHVHAPGPVPAALAMTRHHGSPPPPQAADGALPDRFTLLVDGAGSFRVLRTTRVLIGPVSSSRPVDVPLLADASVPAIRIERCEEDYFLKVEGRSSVTVNDQALPGGTASGRLLRDGDRIALSPRCRVTFRLPSPASTTAALEFSGAAARLARADLRCVLLMGRELIAGPGPAAPRPRGGEGGPGDAGGPRRPTGVPGGRAGDGQRRARRPVGGGARRRARGHGRARLRTGRRVGSASARTGRSRHARAHGTGPPTRAPRVPRVTAWAEGVTGSEAKTTMNAFRYKFGDRPLDGYTIQRPAGRGGFGEVYYAVSDAGREVALKMISGFHQVELRGVSQCMNLKSPHLVTIFDVRHNDEGVPFVIMEYVAGPSLRQLIDESPAGLSTQKAAFFLREIAKGLTYLHDCGIVHRDLKPGNIFYENGSVKIGDYGLSKAISQSQHSAQTITVGTVHYMAPEIGAGRYDKGIDIYALGACLYEMLTGQVPYLGASPAEVLIKHLSAEPDVSGIEEPFASAIRKAMAKDPKQRYQSVQEMVEAVFGAEHVRNSVSVFQPDSLSMIAARVAEKVQPAGASGAPTPVPPMGLTDSWRAATTTTTPTPSPAVAPPAANRMGALLGSSPSAPASGGVAGSCCPAPAEPIVILRRTWTLIGCLSVPLLAGLLAYLSESNAHRTDEDVMMAGCAALALLSVVAVVRAVRARRRTAFHGWWRELARPLLLWACAAMFLMSAVAMGSGRPDPVEFGILWALIALSIVLVPVLLTIRVEPPAKAAPAAPAAARPEPEAASLPPQGEARPAAMAAQREDRP